MSGCVAKKSLEAAFRWCLWFDPMEIRFEDCITWLTT